MEEQLNDCELVNASLRKELSEAKAIFQRDKELLKRATKQHKDRATRNESTLESVSSTLDETVSLHDIQSHLAVSHHPSRMLRYLT